MARLSTAGRARAKSPKKKPLDEMDKASIPTAEQQSQACMLYLGASELLQQPVQKGRQRQACQCSRH